MRKIIPSSEGPYPSPFFQSGLSTAEDYWILLKPRVMALVVFTAWVGLLLAPGHLNPLLGFTAILCIAVGSGAAGALNMWYDSDIDMQMSRTRQRPIPQGRIQPREALGFGLFLSLASVVLMGLVLNLTAAFWLAFTIFFYVVVYTMVLKRRTAQNIVIGGAAGAFPPVIGWAAVSPEFSLAPWALFLIIFLWTPPHFWSLALVKCEDYKKAKIPMLPIVVGCERTKKYIYIYTLLAVAASFVPCLFLDFLGLVYQTACLILGSTFIFLNYRLWKKEMQNSDALKSFTFSIMYLFLIFLFMALDLFF